MRKTKKQIENEKYGGRSLFDLIEIEFTEGNDNEQQNRISTGFGQTQRNIQRNDLSRDDTILDRQKNTTILRSYKPIKSYE